MMSRFGDSLGSESQPRLAPKRHICMDQSPSLPVFNRIRHDFGKLDLALLVGMEPVVA